MKKAQVWSIDFVVGLSLFSLLIVVTTYFLINSNQDNSFEIMHREASYLSNTIISSGTPDEWNETTVIVPGILSDGRLDFEKLAFLNSLSYETLKSLYSVRADFAFFFRNKTDYFEVGDQCSYGYNLPSIDCIPDLSALNYDDLVVINRFIPINNSIKNVVLYVWT